MNGSLTALQRPGEASGEHRLQLIEPTQAGGPLILLLKPEGEARPMPLAVCVHGYTRQPLDQLNAFAPLAARLGFALAVPLFDERQHRRYQQLLHPRRGTRSDLACWPRWMQRPHAMASTPAGSSCLATRVAHSSCTASRCAIHRERRRWPSGRPAGTHGQTHSRRGRWAWRMRRTNSGRPSIWRTSSGCRWRCGWASATRRPTRICATSRSWRRCRARTGWRARATGPMPCAALARRAASMSR
jgi:hypothetical protein